MVHYSDIDVIVRKKKFIGFIEILILEGSCYSLK